MGLERSPDLSEPMERADSLQTMQEEGLTFEQFASWHEENKKQPPWRAMADKEADYLDGNQLDSDLIRKQQAIGMPPAIDPLMGPELNEICGLEARIRKNWKVVPANSQGDEDEQVAEALNQKLFDAERLSKADKACSIAFRKQAGVGVGWLCVDRERDPFKFPYRVQDVNRNDIWWDWKGTQDPDMHDHRYLIRRRWTDKDQAKLFFPDQADLIQHIATSWTSFPEHFINDGGGSTGLQTGQVTWNGGGAVVGAPTLLQGIIPGTYALLYSAYTAEQNRGDTLEEQEWRDSENNRICLFEAWYRIWKEATVFKMPDGRIIELDENNDMHLGALASGKAKVNRQIISKVRLSMWIGPHRLMDIPSPFKHNRFPYVPFWHHREDRTGIPYGLARGWMYHQDTVNSVSGKLRWGLSATVTTRTKGAYSGTDDQLRREAARLDADIVLDQAHMAKPGAKFEMKRDFELTEQQANLLKDSRQSIKRTGMGLDDDNEKNDPLAVLEQIPNKHLVLFDNFRESRNCVGDLLLSLIVEDIEGVSMDVQIPGDSMNPDKLITINKVERHPVFGGPILTNDVSNTLMKVVLEDVPSTPSYRGQQLQSLAEVIKSAPEQFQPILFPFMMNLMDVPNRKKIIDAIRNSQQNPTPEDVENQIKQAVQQALLEHNIDLKTRELDLKEQMQNVQADKIKADTILQRVTALFEAMQGGAIVVNNAGIAPVGDSILKSAGYEPPAPPGVSPGIESAPAAPVAQVPTNTHPNFPPKPQIPDQGARAGIETAARP